MSGALATRPQLTKLAILYTERGMPERERRLAHARMAVNRPALTSSAELTRAEAGDLIELLEGNGSLFVPPALAPEVLPAPGAVTAAEPPGRTAGVVTEAEAIGIVRGPHPCGPDGKHWVTPHPDGRSTTHGPCGTVAHTVAIDRSCPPAVCYCGDCPWWRAAPPVNYAAAIAALREKAGRRR